MEMEHAWETEQQILAIVIHEHEPSIGNLGYTFCRGQLCSRKSTNNALVVVVAVVVNLSKVIEMSKVAFFDTRMYVCRCVHTDRQTEGDTHSVCSHSHVSYNKVFVALTLLLSHTHTHTHTHTPTQ